MTFIKNLGLKTKWIMRVIYYNNTSDLHEYHYKKDCESDFRKLISRLKDFNTGIKKVYIRNLNELTWYDKVEFTNYE